MMRAAVPIAMPVALIAEMMLITLCDFLAKRYRLAMNPAVLILVLSLMVSGTCPNTCGDKGNHFFNDVKPTFACGSSCLIIAQNYLILQIFLPFN